MSFMRFTECLLNNNNKSLKEQQLFEAIRSGDISYVEKLIKDKTIDVNCRHKYGWTPLLLAAVNGWTDICKLLLDYGADINITDGFSTPQMMSIQLGSSDYLQVAMSREMDFSDLM